MNKENINFFETDEISDADYALLLYDKEQRKIKFKLICTVVALLGSIGGYLVMWDRGISGFWYDLCGFLWLVGIISTLIAGSFLKVIKFIFKVGQFFYYIIPFYIFNLLGFVFGLAFGFIVAFSLPVIPCAMSLYQSWKNMKIAEEYLDFEDIPNEE